MATALRNLDVSISDESVATTPHDSPYLYEALPGPFRATRETTSRVAQRLSSPKLIWISEVSPAGTLA